MESLSNKLETIKQMPQNEHNKRDKLLNQLSEELEILDPKLPMTIFLKAQVLEQLASVKKSNSILERAIHLYREILYR